MEVRFARRAWPISCPRPDVAPAEASATIPRMADLRIEKWRRWFDQGITDDIYTMHLERFAWKRMEEIVNGNPALKGTESYLWEFLFNTYAKTQAIRRFGRDDAEARRRIRQPPGAQEGLGH